jgi:MinD-like ATPase involved in chromosome partitioning or flagellar assembly
VASLLAVKGLRVGVVDTDIQSPGIHVLFGLKEDEMYPALNDYLWGECEVQEAAHDGISPERSTWFRPASRPVKLCAF